MTESFVFSETIGGGSVMMSFACKTFTFAKSCSSRLVSDTSPMTWPVSSTGTCDMLFFFMTTMISLALAQASTENTLFDITLFASGSFSLDNKVTASSIFTAFE